MNRLPDEILTTVHSMLYILNKLGGKSDYHKIFKILYFADQKHLARYGSPVIEDKYIAMKNGPVPSNAYDIQKTVKGEIKWANLEDVFSTYFENISPYEVIALKHPDMDYLSKSEVAALDESIKENRGLSFGDLTEKSHDFAWNSANKNGDINILDIARSGQANEAMIDYIKEHLENATFKCL